MSWPTTRRHPRSLREAYPMDHAEWMWIDSAARRWQRRILRALGWAVVLAFFIGWGVVAAHWFVTGIA